MAVIIGSTNNNAWTYKADVYNIGAPDIENNESTMRVDVWLGRASTTSYVGGTWSGHISINWETDDLVQIPISGAIPYPTYINGGDWYHLATVDFPIKHDADGSKIIRVTTEITRTQFTPSYCVADDWVKLITIPRATTAPDLSGWIGTSYNYSLSPAAEFMHSIYIKFGGIQKWLQADGKLGDNEYKFSTNNTSPIFTIPKSFYNEFTTREGKGIITVKTYSRDGITYIGESTGNLTAICQSALCSPTISTTESTVVDINPITLALTGNENNIVRFASNVKVTPTISVSDSEDTKTTLISKSVNNIVFTDDSIVLPEVSDKTFNVNATNSRNMPALTTRISATGILIPYVKLTFNINKLYRPEPTTGEISLEYSGNYYAGSFRPGLEDDIANELTIAWKYKLKGESDDKYVDGGVLTPTINVEKNTYNGDISLGTMFDYTQQYDFMFYYSDKIVSKVEHETVSRGIPVYWWTANSFHIQGDLYVEGQINPTD